MWPRHFRYAEDYVCLSCQINVFYGSFHAWLVNGKTGVGPTFALRNYQFSNGPSKSDCLTVSLSLSLSRPPITGDAASAPRLVFGSVAFGALGGARDNGDDGACHGHVGAF